MVLPRKYNCFRFDNFCTILTDISLIMNTSDYCGSIVIDQIQNQSNSINL